LRVIEVEVFKFDELEEEAKAKAIKQNVEINVDYEWWDSSYEWFMEKLEKVGIGCSELYFDFGRAWCIYMDKPYFSDERKFLKFCKVDLRSKLARSILREETDYLSIEKKHYSGSRAENYVKVVPNVIGYFGEYDEYLSQCLKELLYDFLDDLRKEYENLLSDESIADTLKVNEYEFTKDGDMI
jgi:hypothetical protein